LAIALFRKGDIEGAIVHLQKVLRINPEHIRAKNMLKDILTIQQ
jgi:Flp pilus assembly protein TadD